MHRRVRIISGRWRRRLIHFDSNAGIRPTTDAARETLFNWLRDKIAGANCLDLFAGSGVLSLEALSRGASKVVAVDNNKTCTRAITLAASELDAKNLTVVHATAKRYLQTTKECFDIVFIDPPFFHELVPQTLQQILLSDCLNPGAVVYIESEANEAKILLDHNWVILRSKSTNSRNHQLIRQSDQAIN